jgi:hypothetical protein
VFTFLAISERLFPSLAKALTSIFIKCKNFFDPTVRGQFSAIALSASLFFQVFEFQWLIFGVILPYAGNKGEGLVVQVPCSAGVLSAESSGN